MSAGMMPVWIQDRCLPGGPKDPSRKPEVTCKEPHEAESSRCYSVPCPASHALIMQMAVPIPSTADTTLESVGTIESTPF